MSQSLKQIPQSMEVLELSLEKYSYNLSHVDAKTNTYNHVQEPGRQLNIIVRTEVVQQGNGMCKNDVVLRIYFAGRVVEVLNLTTLLLQQKQNATSARPKVKVVKRPPYWIALCYPKSDFLIQRYQLKFSSVYHFNLFRQLFEDMGFLIQDSPLSLRVASNAMSMSSSSPAPSTISAKSTTSTSTLLGLPSRPNSALEPISEMSENVHSQLQVKPSHVEQMRRPISQCLSDHGTEALVIQSAIKSQASISSVPPARTNSKQTSELTHTVGYPGFFTAHVLANVHKQPKVCHTRKDESATQVGMGDLAITGTSSVEVFENTIRDLRIRYPAITTSHVSETGNDARPPPVATLEIPAQKAKPAIRPASAPVCTGASQDLYIPPRRERPPSAMERTRSKFNMTASPLPKPTLIDRNQASTLNATSSSTVLPPAVSPITLPTDKTAYSVVATNKTHAMAALPAHPIMENVKIRNGAADTLSTIAEEDPSPLAAKPAKFQQPSSTTILDSKDNLPEKRPASTQPLISAKRVKMIDVGVQVHRLLPPSGQIPALSAAVELATQPDKVQEYLETIDSYVTKFKPSRREILSTMEYQIAPQEERDRMFEEFICNNLQDPNFLQLGSDLDRQYRRIGLEAHRD